MRREVEPCVHLRASQRNGTLYRGVTSNLMQRIAQHRDGTFGGFAGEYGVRMLVWFERHDAMEAAIGREKRIKKWRRAWKLELIEAENPRWRDLALNFGFAELPPLGSRVRGNDKTSAVIPANAGTQGGAR